MICFVAFALFGFLGIFSAKYRGLTKESFECVFKRITFKPCESKLDQRIRTKIVGKVFKKNKTLAGLLNRHFEAISWIFVILMVVSAVLSMQAVYNLIVFNNCNGPNSSEACVLATTTESCSEECQKRGGCTCQIEGCNPPEFQACNGQCNCDATKCEELK